MSTDDKWLDLGDIADIKHLPGGYHNRAEEFNEYAPYGLNHRKPVDIHWAFKKSESLLVAELEEAAFRDFARDNIKRLFKPQPHTD